MTGFGGGEAALAGGRIVVEARSLNHRFVEARVALPAELGQHAFFVEQRLRQRARRGRYNVVVRIEGERPTIDIDRARARAAFGALAALRDDIAPGEPLPLSLLGAVPELFRAAELAPESVQHALADALDAALAELEAMRAREGALLAEELRREIERARQCRHELAELHCRAAERQRARLRERIERLAQDAGVTPDAPRLETELAIVADRSDVAEELARIDSHLAQFEELMGLDEAVGRRLDFLLQELGREANTIASKSADAPLSQRVIDLKAILERLREQVQNVE